MLSHTLAGLVFLEFDTHPATYFSLAPAPWPQLRSKHQRRHPWREPNFKKVTASTPEPVTASSRTDALGARAHCPPHLCSHTDSRPPLWRGLHCIVGVQEKGTYKICPFPVKSAVPKLWGAPDHLGSSFKAQGTQSYLAVETGTQRCL